jgi:hypothetical protein
MNVVEGKRAVHEEEARRIEKDFTIHSAGEEAIAVVARH